MKRLILFFCATLVQLCIPIITIAATGDVFTDGQFKYTVISEELKTLELKGLTVTPEEITGDVIIPETVRFNDITYSVISIGNSAFCGSIGMTSIEIPSSITSIGDNTFSQCTGLKSIKIPEAVISIGNYTFYACIGLTSVEIPASLTSIGYMCFAFCTQLTTVTSLASTPPTLSEDAFVKEIATITVPEEALSSYQNSDWADYFANLSKQALMAGDSFNSQQFSFTILDDKLNTVALAGLTLATDELTGNAVIPETVEYDGITYSVTEIGDNVFNKCRGLNSIDIPNSITSIGKYAFFGCKNLNNVSCHALNPPTLADYVFNYNIPPITVPEEAINSYQNSDWANFFSSFFPLGTVTTIANGPFRYTLINRELKTLRLEDLTIDKEEIVGSIVIPETIEYDGITYTVTEIGRNSDVEMGVFRYCENMTDCVIPNTITLIGGNTFYGCSGLKSFKIPNSVTTIGVGAFSWCTGLTSIEIPSSITELNKFIFHSCTGLTRIKIPSSINSIKVQALYGCSGLTSIEIPNSVTSIGTQAFSKCSGITSIQIPNSVVSLGDGVFYGCTGLTAIEIPNSITEFMDRTFENCTSLKNFEIPSSVTSIGIQAFYNCAALTSIELPASLTSIGDSCFKHCTQLTTVTSFATTPPSLGEDAFVKDIAKVNVSEEALSSYQNSDWAQYFTTLRKQVLVAGDKFDSQQFSFTILDDNFNTVALTGRATGIIGISGNVVIPETVQYNSISYSVTKIGAYAFRRNTGLISVEIPNSVTSIDFCAFNGCRSLTSIVIPNSVTEIGGSAFSDCISLTSVKIPNSVTSTGQNVFSGCTGLMSVEIPNSVTEIEAYAFSNCTGLVSVEIPNSVTSIGEKAFNGCEGLTSIDISNSISSIGNEAFRDCLGLTSIEFPASITSIGEKCFDGTPLTTVICKAITPPILGTDAFLDMDAAIMTVPEEAINSYQNSDWAKYYTGFHPLGTVTTFVNGQFKFNLLDLKQKTVRLSGLTVNKGDITGNVVIPETIEYDGVIYSVVKIDPGYFIFSHSGIFSGCSNMTGCEIPNSVTGIGPYTFTGCSSLLNIEIPNSVTSIGNSTFSGCTGLTSIKIPNSVTLICDSVFNGCTDLTSIKIPDSITSIGHCAFNGCTNLTSIKIPDSVTSIGHCAFNGCTNLTNIEIPNSVTSIGNLVFRGCIRLRNIEIPNSVTSIGSYVFRGCTALASVIIPNSVTSIGSGAFFSCWGLKSIDIPASVTKIGDECFYDCINLKEVICHATTPPTLGGRTFTNYSATLRVPEEALSSYYNYTWISYFRYFETLAKEVLVTGDKFTSQQLNYTILDDKLNTVALTGVDVAAEALTGNVVIPETVTYNDVTYTVISIGDEAFSGYNAVTGIDIPASVTEIGASAFFNCSALTTLRLPDGVTTIPEALCSGCSSLEKVYFSDKVNKIGEYAFQYCSRLRSMIVPDGVTEIPAMMMRGCTSIIEILIPNSVTKIGAQAFSGCSSLKNVDLGTGVYEIANLAFEKCDKITDLHCMASNPPYAEMYSFSTAAYKDVTVTVKEQSLTKYNRENPWYRFEKYLTVAGAVSLSHYEVEMGSNEVFQLGVYGSENKIEWTSTNPSVAYANECGLIVAMGIAGTTVISANVDGEKVDCRVTVLAKRTPLMSRAGDAEEPGEPVDIILESIGGNPPMVNVRLVPVGSCTVIDWSSSDTSLATVENGLVTVHQAGEVSFGVETGNGLEETLVTDTEELKTSGLQNIVNMEHTAIVDNNVYDLSGRCVLVNATPEQIKSLRKGIYIVNGKKLLVK